MQTRHLPRASGVYQIINRVNGKVYVGSAVDIQVRLHNHRRELRSQQHCNQKLQNAWDKHGEAAFDVRVIELIPDPQDLLPREQYWLDLLQSVKNGYNCLPTAGSNLGYKATDVTRERSSRAKARPMQGFITPDGATVTILNLYLFCKANGLTSQPMRMLAAGTATSYKGWTHSNAKLPAREWKKTYQGFIDPAGREVPPVTNLAAFCREHGLIPSNMSAVYLGHTTSHRGWTHVRHNGHVNLPQRARRYPGHFVSPEGQRFTVTNLRQFSQGRGLLQSGMHQLFSGKKRQYKGWTYQPESEEQT